MCRDIVKRHIGLSQTVRVSLAQHTDMDGSSIVRRHRVRRRFTRVALSQQVQINDKSTV